MRIKQAVINVQSMQENSFKKICSPKQSIIMVLMGNEVFNSEKLQIPAKFVTRIKTKREVLTEPLNWHV